MYKKGTFMPTKEYLEEAYTKRGMTYSDIASECNVTPAAVCYWFKKFGIAPRKKGMIVHPHIYSNSERKRISKQHKGKKLSDESKIKISEARKLKGIGHEKMGKDGYIKVYYPDHPFASKDGYVRKHRLIMEQHIGRYLTKDEVVHHKNHVKNDNRISNLELMTAKQHSALHMKERRKNEHQ